MSLDVTEHFELPLPHPDNSPRTVDVPRLRAALTAIDGLIKELQDQAEDLDEGKADKSQVATDIANAVSAAVSELLAGAPEAYDTLKEIADKLGDNDGAVGAILSQIAALQSGKADLVSGKVPLAQLPVASSEDAAAGTGDGLMKAGQVGGHVDAKIVEAIDDLRHVEYTAKYAINAQDPVALLADGRVVNTDIAPAQVGTAVELDGVNGSCIATCYDPSNDAFIVFWRDDGAKSGKAAVCRVEGTSVTVGPVATFSAGELQVADPSLSVCFDTVRNQAVVAYKVGSSNSVRLRTCQVGENDTLSFGTELNTGDTATALAVCYDKSIDKVVLSILESTSHDIFVIGATGSELTAVASKNLHFTVGNTYAAGIVHCEGHATPGLNVVSYGISGSRTAVAPITIDPETFDITQGTYSSPGYSANGNALAWSRRYQRVFWIHPAEASTYVYTLERATAASTGLSGVAGVVIDTSGAASDPHRNPPSIASLDDGEMVAVVWADRGSSYAGKLRFTNSAGATTLGFQTEIQFHSGNTGWSSIAFADDGVRGIVAFSPGFNPDTGTPKVVAIVAPKLNWTTSFVGFAANDAAPGEKVKVIPPLGIDRSRTGLVPGTKYTFDNSGKMATGVSANKIAFALSETDLLVLDGTILD